MKDTNEINTTFQDPQSNCSIIPTVSNNDNGQNLQLFSMIPLEIFSYITLYLEPRSLCNLEEVSQDIKKAAESNPA